MSHGLNLSLQCASAPHLFVTHQDYLGKLRADNGTELFRSDASFRLIKGLADPACVSFEAVGMPGFYLRHQDYAIKLNKHDGTELFSTDATFYIRPGLAGHLHNSFECYAPRNFYLSHNGTELRIEKHENTAQFRRAATFTIARCAMVPANANVLQEADVPLTQSLGDPFRLPLTNPDEELMMPSAPPAASESVLIDMEGDRNADQGHVYDRAATRLYPSMFRASESRYEVLSMVD
eukprot:EC716636.1.p1 GENE.EC716636.1~~EC716636.1.p1  ORF type:complete len:236 (+),score=46.95 EC716636.1:1-708(+)